MGGSTKSSSGSSSSSGESPGVKDVESGDPPSYATDGSGVMMATDGGEGRSEWGNHCEFFLTSLGLAVGLGNIWWGIPHTHTKRNIMPSCFPVLIAGGSPTSATPM